MKISSLIASVILASIVIIGVSNLVSNLNTNYGTDINETEFEEFSKIQELTNLTEQTNEQVNAISHDPNFIDKLSSFFNAGIIALKTTFSSFDIITTMIDNGLYKVGLGQYALAIKSMFLVFVIIGVAIGSIIKWKT